MKKRYSAVDLTDLAIGILVLGITVTIGARMLLTYRDNRLTDLGTVTTHNETTFINSTGDTLANTWGKSVSTCYCNVTGSGTATACAVNNTIVSANYTVSISSSNGVITLTNATAATFNDAACTYDWYNTSEVQWDLPNKAVIGLGEYGNWFDIIVIVGIAGLILAIIFIAFGRKGEDTGVVY